MTRGITSIDRAQRSAPWPPTVLAGCSFAGLELLYRLVRSRGRFAPGEMTVIDPRERHPYIPLTHEAVSGVRAPEALLFDTPAFCRAIGAEWVTGAVSGLDPARRLVRLADGREIPYGRLVLAIGSVPDVPGLLEQVPVVVPAKFLTDALALRRYLQRLRAAGTRVPRVVVVGAGITGVEWSAELAGGRVNGARLAVTLIGAGPRVLPHFHPAISRRAAHALSELRIELLLGHRVTAVARDRLILDGRTSVPFDVVVWTGGVRPAPAVAALGLPVTRRGHLVISPRFTVPGYEGIYGLGDCARIVENGMEWPTLERAIEAVWQGASLARRLAAGWAPDAGPVHRLRRDFPYGLSLGPRRSAIVYKGLYLESPAFVHGRRWLQWSYYARFRLLAWWLERRVAGRGVR